MNISDQIAEMQRKIDVEVKAMTPAEIIADVLGSDRADWLSLQAQMAAYRSKLVAKRYALMALAEIGMTEQDYFNKEA